MEPPGTKVTDINIRQRWRAVWKRDLFYFLCYILLQGTYHSDHCANFMMPGLREWVLKTARRKEIHPENTLLRSKSFVKTSCFMAG